MQKQIHFYIIPVSSQQNWKLNILLMEELELISHDLGYIQKPGTRVSFTISTAAEIFFHQQSFSLEEEIPFGEY